MSSNIHFINEHDRVNEHDREHREKVRSLGETVNTAKQEFKQFAETRLAMLQSEMRDKMAAMKAALPILVIGAVVAWLSALCLTAALVCAIYTAFKGSEWAPFLACLIVGVSYAIIGFGALFFGYSKISEKGLVPERTIQVLKDDKLWLQNEARTQL
jgi:mannose/fructose/N-acetylgalactosamine-specific phosphotransferase system component IID